MKIVYYPHPALRYKARPVLAIDNELRRIVAEMLELMYANKGIGLAAPQVALPYQVFVLNTSGDANQREHQHVYINPTILERKGGLVEGEEGCLSFPGLFQKVRRPKQIRVHAYDQTGQVLECELSDLEARAVQHETDHLHAKLYIDMFGPIAKLSSRSSLAELERDFRRAQEKGEIPANKAILRLLRELETKQVPSGAVL